jgi:hypothetical protein
MPQMVERECLWCKKMFMARVADIRRGWALFHSKRCKAMEQENRTGQYAALRAQSLHDDARAAEEDGWDGHKNTF